jgi:hypothetical protein
VEGEKHTKNKIEGGKNGACSLRTIQILAQIAANNFIGDGCQHGEGPCLGWRPAQGKELSDGWRSCQLATSGQGILINTHPVSPGVSTRFITQFRSSHFRKISTNVNKYLNG